MSQQTQIIEQCFSYKENEVFTTVDVAHALDMPLTNVSSIVSRIWQAKYLHRSNAKKAGRYEYWWSQHSRPKKLSSIDEAIARNDHRQYLRRKKQQQGNGTGTLPRRCDLLISIPAGENDTVTLDLKQAKAVYKQLHDLFG